MIIFPVISDQDYNALMLEELGVAKSLEICTIKEQELASALSELIIGKRYLKKGIIRCTGFPYFY